MPFRPCERSEGTCVRSTFLVAVLQGLAVIGPIACQTSETRPDRTEPFPAAPLVAHVNESENAETDADSSGVAPRTRSGAAAPKGRFIETNTALLQGPQRPSTASVTYELPEITGGGVALFDYDHDGDLDILQARWPHHEDADALAPNRLYQQQSDGSFRDVTRESGLGHPGYGQGIAIGDFDNDGDLDVYATNVGSDALYRNRGDGTFVEISDIAGIRGSAWSTSAAFFDYDRDGYLDLFVAHYVDYESGRICEGLDDARDYCGPQEFSGTVDTLYHNEGDGTFSDVSTEAGIQAPGKGLGVLCSDFTGDGLVDIYVANDGEVNQLWVNRGDGRFDDEAVLMGVGFNAYGNPEASMGIALGDVDQDGGLDLFVTHLTGETNTLYLATPYPIYTDGSDASGLSAIDVRFTGFGCGLFDFDHDGDLDLAVANGRVKRGSRLPGTEADSFWAHYAEPNLLLENTGGGRFRDVTEKAPEYAHHVEVSRGLSFGDIDQDGDVDFLVGNLEGSLRLYKNNKPASENSWLLVRALTGNRDALGARVSIVAESHRWDRLVLAAYSYASSSEPTVHFGLGDVKNISSLEVQWPDGLLERFPPPSINRRIVVRQGTGVAW